MKGGCASAPAPVVDNSPLLRTAQITSEVTSSGIKGLFGHKGTNTSVTYENMRRVDSGFKFTGSIMGRIGGYLTQNQKVILKKQIPVVL